MNTAERYLFNKQLNYATVQTELKSNVVDEILGKPSIANFINPMAALGLAGAGLGGLQGALQQDEYGQPISTADRLGRVALGGLGGGALGAGAGALAGAYKPQILRSIDPVPEKGMTGIREILGSDLGDKAAEIEANNRRIAAQVAKETADREAISAARTAQTEARRQARASRRSNIGERYETIADSIANSQAESAARIGDVVENVRGVGKVVRQKADPLISKVTAVNNRIENAGGLMAGPQAVVDNIKANPKVQQVVNNAVEAGTAKAKPVFDRIWNKGQEQANYWSAAVKDAVKNGPFHEPIIDPKQLPPTRFNKHYLKAAKFGLFDQVPDNLPTPVLAAGALGLGTGASLGAANAITQNNARENKQLQNIYTIPDPDARVKAFDDYTSNPDAAMRGLGNTSNILGHTALAAGGGALGGGLLGYKGNQLVQRYKNVAS
jgi:hypothetical protein